MHVAVVTGELDDAALRGEVAAEDARGRRVALSGVSIGTTTSCPGLSTTAVGDLAERAPVDVGGLVVDETRLSRALARRGRRHPLVDVGRVEAAARLHVATTGVRAATRSKSSIVNGMPNSRAIARRWRTPLVEPPVAGDRQPRRSRAPPASRSAKDGVFAPDERPSRAAPSRMAASVLPRIERRDAVEPARGSGPRNSSTVDIVFAVNWPPHAPAPGQATDLELVQLLRGHLPGRVGADRLEDVAAIVTSRPRKQAGRDRARVEDEPRDVEAAECHDRGRVSSCRSATRQTRPSKRWPRATSSIESAMTSRETSDARMPSVPMETPSETATVLNSIGVAARLADAALHLQGERRAG